MVTLNGRKPADTYQGILHIDNGLTAGLKQVEDGLGVNGPIAMSKTEINIVSGSTFTAGAGSTVDFTGSTLVGFGALVNIVEDITPQLGGNLDVNGKSIVSVAAGDIAITPDTTGKIILDGLNWPIADGTTGQILKTDGVGNLTFVTPSNLTTLAALTDTIITTPASNEHLVYNGLSWVNQAVTTISNLIEDTTPQLGGNLDTQTFTVDGRNISVDGTKLDGIEALATADQTGLEIKTAYELNANTNAFTDADVTTLNSALQGITSEPIENLNNVSITTPVNTEVLTYNSGVWTNSTASGGIMNNLIDDTTPQLGGNLDTNGKNINVTGTGFGFDITTTTEPIRILSTGTASITLEADGFGEITMLGTGRTNISTASLNCGPTTDLIMGDAIGFTGGKIYLNNDIIFTGNSANQLEIIMPIEGTLLQNQTNTTAFTYTMSFAQTVDYIDYKVTNGVGVIEAGTIIIVANNSGGGITVNVVNVVTLGAAIGLTWSATQLNNNITINYTTGVLINGQASYVCARRSI